MLLSFALLHPPVIQYKDTDMSFKVYTHDGHAPHMAWFTNVDQLLRSMLANPNHTYHRIDK
jgi:hypothetical protein